VTAQGIVSFLVLLTLAAPRPTVAAETPPSDPRVQEAKAACAAGRVEEGIATLARLYAESNEIMWVFNQGRCYQQNGRDEQALQRFREFLLKSSLLSAEEVREDAVRAARAHIASLEARVAPPAPARAAPLPDGPRPRYRLVSAALGVVGVAGLAAGMAFGLRTRSLENKLQQDSASGLVPGSRYSEGKRAETWQWVGYAAGAAALVAGALLFYVGSPGEAPRASLTMAPLVSDRAGGVTLGGRF
jgi:hypothetical protein